jgi:hypothetical protein
MKTKRILLKYVVILLSILLLIIGSCEKSAEKKFDHSLIPGEYESFISPWVTDSAFIMEIFRVNKESYIFSFPDFAPGFPDQLAVSITHYIEDPSGTTDAIMACVKLTGESEFELVDTLNYTCSGYIQIVPPRGEMHYHLNLMYIPTKLVRKLHGMRRT